ncbi:MAG: hypothetical protein QOG62_1316 [Thermoleophilaceae bacterium]|jgi:hypothetical protein|nr:hypothetical protein [Thermoleophilaceae bacterium]
MTQSVELDPAAFAATFGQSPTRVGHTLAEEELLSVEALAVLAESLPVSSVEHNLGNVPTVVPGGEAPRVDMGPGQIARGIETNGCWMVLKNIEQEPAYRDLLNRALDDVEEAVGTLEGGMRQREGFIFLSSPGSITPSHTDPEHNLLLQIRGSKCMEVGSFPDAETRERVLEGQIAGHRNLDCMPHDAQAFELTPGCGIYVPVHAPHCVTNGPTVSVSLSITFRTPLAKRQERAVAFNARLRKLGLSPVVPGRRPAVDAVKAMAMRTLNSLKIA